MDFDCTDQIFSATPPDATPTALTPRNLDLFDEHPAVSPAGTNIVFERIDAGFLSDRSVWLMSIDGSGKKKLTATGADGEPAWWP